MQDSALQTGSGAVPSRYWVVDAQGSTAVCGGVIEESTLAIDVNGQELATLMCSPLDHEALALGFLYSEGVIDALEDVRLVRLNTTRTLADVFLRRAHVTLPRRITLTSGCSGGVLLQDPHASHPPLGSTLAITPQTLIARMGDLHRAAELYARVHGVHTSILASPDGLLLSAEDIGRHNTLDKLAGKALLQGIDPRDRIVLTTGRISSEMLIKARRMGVPLVASLTSPTSAALALAQAWAICVVGYLRAHNLRVYTHPQRLGLPEAR